MAGLHSIFTRVWRLVAPKPRPIPLDLDGDAQIVFHVAQYEATARGQALSALHLVYGLLRDETFTAAIERLGGDTAAIEHHLLEELDRQGTAQPVDEVAQVLGRAALVARSTGRPTSCTDLWAYLSRTGAARSVAAGSVEPKALAFLLAHGVREQDLSVSTATVVNVVLRNDDYTPMEIVVRVLRDVFALPEPEAISTMRTAHEHGRAIVGRLALEVARAKVEAGRTLARDLGFPLWLGVEDC